MQVFDDIFPYLSRWGVSNEYPQNMFFMENLRKLSPIIIKYPPYLFFCYAYLLGQLSGRGQHESLAFCPVYLQLLENGDGEGRSFTSPRLGLRYYITAWRYNQRTIGPVSLTSVLRIC